MPITETDRVTPADPDSQTVWFAMSAPDRRELKARDYLQAKGI